MIKNEVSIRLGAKVSEKHIDQIINDFYKAFEKDKAKQNIYEFDFSGLRWISNQELLVLTGLFKYLIEIEIVFKVNFFVKGSNSNIDKHVARQIVQIWNVWQIFQIVPDQDYENYFDINGDEVEDIRRQYNISSSTQQIYDRYGVTPFLSLPKIEKYDDKAVSKLLNKIYSLSEATNQLLVKNNCYLPFENKTLSSIITKELYENFIDHFTTSFFDSQSNFSFLSISLKRKLNEKIHAKKKIQSILDSNFKDENIEEFKPFFFAESSAEFKNESLLQISFLDYGEGIPKTLFQSFSSQGSIESEGLNIDSEILKYAFEPLSSQHSVEDRYSKEIITPRGLFDVVAIVKRFEGLVVVRSNHGKIAFDFSDNKSIEDAIVFFGNEDLFFPGTLISIYIPERQLSKKFDSSSIKPKVNFTNYNFKKSNKKTVRLFDIQKQLELFPSSKDDLYNNLFELLLNELSSEDNDALIYLDFEGYEIDERVAKKIIYFISSDYRFNYRNNVIVLNPPSKQFLQNINDEISELEEVDKKFRFHPTPFIYFNGIDDELEIYWLGIYSDNDIKKLNDLLFEMHDLRASDFENPDDIIGHVNRYDKYGNLYSAINSKEIFEFYKEKKEDSIQEEINSLISGCIQKEKGSIYLCNGNYYQYEYLLLNEVLSEETKLDYLSRTLFSKLKERLGDYEDVLFAGITSSSHSIIDSLISQGYLKTEKCVKMDNYFSFETEKEFSKLTCSESKVVLLIDVISSGHLVKRFESHIKKYGTELLGIGVIVNAIDNNFLEYDYSDIEKKLSSTFNYKLEKKLRSEISDKLKTNELKVIRINPFTNTPILHSIEETNSADSILFDNQDFINIIDSSQIKIGYFEFNNIIHPYFFDMDSVLDKSQKTSNQLLSELFKRLEKKKIVNDTNLVFYPKDSGISNMNFDYFRNNIISNHSTEFIKLERFATNEGWRFSHPSRSLINKSRDKKALILDDGSCSGESLLQMVDEVAFLEVKEIIVLSIVGRVNDHKREFFSRLKTIKSGRKSIKICVFFGSHWHLPTYHLSKSPVTDELNWLQSIQSYTNIPLKLKNVIKIVSNELKLKSINDDNNNHLIKTKDHSDIIKDLLIVRHELGKLTEFRFYKEYFAFLDNFIAKYESKSVAVRGKNPYIEIEQICGVIIHEPYLFDSLKKVVPDLVEKLKDFLNALFWNKETITPDLLTYEWDVKNLIHLLFIVYNENEILNDIGFEKLSQILKQYCYKTSDKIYLFYRILKKIHVKDNNITLKYSSKEFLHLSNELISLIETDESHFRMIYSFFASLPNDSEGYHLQLDSIISNYKKLKEDSSHNEYIFNDKQVIIALLKVIEKNNRTGTDSTSEIKSIKKSWKQISEFIDSLLRFSSTYPDYFINDLDYLNLEKSDRSLRTLYGEVSKEIYDENLSNASVTAIKVNEIFEEFIDEDTVYSKLFSQPNKINISDYYLELIKQIKENNPSFTFKESVTKDIWIDFPCYYFETIILKEIAGNIRFADSKDPIEIEVYGEGSKVVLILENTIIIDTGNLKGGGKGASRLGRLNEFDQFTSYKTKKNKNKFNQKLTFKKT